MLVLNGSNGEGGGQVLRTALTLSAISGQPFRIERIREKRRRPGLLRQHLTAVNAIAAVCNARLTGAELGAAALTFVPGSIRHGDYHFAVGTAGSALLVFQTLLPALLMADGRSRLRFEGGTHNPQAPPFDFVAHTFVPLLHRMGASVMVELERPGFYPAGGGCFEVEIAGGGPLVGLSLLERGKVECIDIEATVAKIPQHVAEREAEVLARRLPDFPTRTRTQTVASAGPGNVVTARVRCGHVTETFSGFGQVGIRAEQVAHGVANEVRKYLASDRPVGEHLADQLLLPCVLAGDSAYRCQTISMHTRTNIDTIDLFLPGRTLLDEANLEIRTKKAEND